MISRVSATSSDRLRAAVDASLSWYDALCALHGVPCGIEDDLWLAYAQPPPLHSTAKSVEPTARPDRALRLLEAYEHGGIADSFGRFDLTREGFDLLFEAQWIHRPSPATGSRALPAGWSVVRTTTELRQWTAHHDTQDVLLPALLDRSSFRVLAKRQDDDLVAGAVLHLGTGAVDVSNVWSTDSGGTWDDIVGLADALFPGRDLVGYESGGDLDQARAAGFATLGPQLVWVR